MHYAINKVKFTLPIREKIDITLKHCRSFTSASVSVMSVKMSSFKASLLHFPINFEIAVARSSSLQNKLQPALVYDMIRH